MWRCNGCIHRIHLSLFGACVSVDAASDFAAGVDLGSLSVLDATVMAALPLWFLALRCESADAASVFSAGDAALLANILPALLAIFVEVFSIRLFFEATVISLVRSWRSNALPIELFLKLLIAEK